MTRANWLGVPAMFNLQAACAMIVQAYGWNVYLVGSCMERRDYRDVDVRCILDDAEFARLFPGAHAPTFMNARLALLNAAISEWLASRTGLPIDFQFQQQTEANEKFSQKNGHPRSALGVFFTYRDADEDAGGQERAQCRAEGKEERRG